MTRLFAWSERDESAVLVNVTSQVVLDDLVNFYTEGRGSHR